MIKYRVLLICLWIDVLFYTHMDRLYTVKWSKYPQEVYNIFLYETKFTIKCLKRLSTFTFFCVIW